MKFRGSRDLERILLFSLGVPLRRDSVLIETICMDICITDSIMNFKYVEKRSISDDLDILYSSQRRNLGLAESTRILFSVETLFILESRIVYIYGITKNLYVAYIIPILLLIVHTDMEKIVVVDRE